MALSASFFTFTPNSSEMFDNALNPVTHCDELDPEPTYFFIIMTSLGIIGCIINISTIFCVFHKTNRKMKDYKAIVIFYQAIVSMNDFIMTIIIRPILFSPLPFCIITGIGKYSSYPKRFWLTLMLSLLVASSASITGLFHYRLNIIIFDNGIKRIARSIILRVIFAFLLAVPIIAIAIFFKSSLPYEVILQKYFDVYNCTVVLSTYEGFLMIDREFAAAASRFGLVESLLLVIISMIMAIVTYFKIASNKNIFSHNTMRLQKKFQITLFCQIFLPLSVVILPNLMFNIIGTFATISQQELSNLLVAMVSSHGMIFNISLVLQNKEYLDYSREKISALCPFRRISESNSVSVLLKH